MFYIYVNENVDTVSSRSSERTSNIYNLFNRDLHEKQTKLDL